MKSIDMEGDDLDVYVDGHLVLHIGQVSDKETINLFLYPMGFMDESMIHREDPSNRCTHEILYERNKDYG